MYKYVINMDDEKENNQDDGKLDKSYLEATSNHSKR